MEAAWTGLCVSDGEPMDVRVIKCFVSVLFLQQEVHYAALSSSFFSGPSIYHVFSWSWIKALLTEKKIKLAAMLIVDERNACKFEKERLILYSCSPVGTTCRLDMIACKQTNSSGQIRIEKNWWIVDWKKRRIYIRLFLPNFPSKSFIPRHNLSGFWLCISILHATNPAWIVNLWLTESEPCSSEISDKIHVWQYEII